jgi:oxygen-dependent protoporphyrinogen oxidase
MTSPAPQVAVLGGGITGLTAAWHLRAAGLAPLVLEQSARPGGAIGSHRDGDWLHELGPNSLLENSADIARLLAGLGLTDRILTAAPTARRRYLVRAGRVLPLPGSPLGFLTTPLFSTRAKLSLLGEPFRPRAPDDAVESVANFVLRRLGREFLDYAINPFVGGVYAGDPHRLSVRHAFSRLHALEQAHGSLLRGALARRNTSGGPAGRMLSFPEGLEELPGALARNLGASLLTRSAAHTVSRVGTGWEVGFTTDGQPRRERFAAVVSALPADALAALRWEGIPLPGQLTSLGGITHPPVVSVFTGYRRADVTHPLDGFGLLVPEVERGRVLGSLFSSSLFPGRAPAGHVALTTFVGGTRQPELAELDDGPLLDVVRAELGRLLGVRGEPTYVHLRRWRRAIPQYGLDHQRHLDACSAFEAQAPGCFLGGTARDGISLSACLDAGLRLARAATDHLSGSGPRRSSP